jgi:hypothetical protein
MQLTFRRGHYTGQWVAENVEYVKEETGFYPPGGSGSLRIFFNDKEVTHLHDITEKSAGTIFTDYVRPDTQEIAERIYSDITNKGVAYQILLRKVMVDHEVIQEDIEIIRENLKSLMHRDGHDTSEIEEDMKGD